MRPLVIGHAAAAGEAPANTLAGVRRCLEVGADAMEIDVQVSSDAVPVLLHDNTLDRTTDLTGPVREQPLSALRSADAGNGEWVPSLEEVLGLVDGRLTVMCELKATPNEPEHDALVVDRVVEQIGNLDAASWTAIHSFNPRMCELARERDPAISTAVISPPVSGGPLAALLDRAVRIGCQAVSVGHPALDTAAVRQAALRQLTVWAWTADVAADWDRLQEAGVSGIITNLPHRLRAHLDG